MILTIIFWLLFGSFILFTAGTNIVFLAWVINKVRTIIFGKAELKPEKSDTENS